MNHFSSLPNEILVNIFRYLSLVINLINRRVCIKWYNLISCLPRPTDIGLPLKKIASMDLGEYLINPVVIDNKLIISQKKYCDGSFRLCLHDRDFRHIDRIIQMNGILYWTKPHVHKLYIKHGNHTIAYPSFKENNRLIPFIPVKFWITIHNDIIVEVVQELNIYVLKEINNELVCIFTIIIAIHDFPEDICLDESNNLLFQVYKKQIKLYSIDAKQELQPNFRKYIQYYKVINGNLVSHIIKDLDPRYKPLKKSKIDQCPIIIYNGFLCSLRYHLNQMAIYQIQ